jgi:hypothetical protein
VFVHLLFGERVCVRFYVAVYLACFEQFPQATEYFLLGLARLLSDFCQSQRLSRFLQHFDNLVIDLSQLLSHLRRCGFQEIAEVANQFFAAKLPKKSPQQLQL